MIRLLADENVPRQSVALLRNAGIDVAVAASGADDEAILARAALESRILVTLDRDFGRLAFERGRAALPGVVYLRLRSPRPEACAEALLSLLRDTTMVLEGRFTAVRATRLPPTPAATAAVAPAFSRCGDAADAASSSSLVKMSGASS